ncbi:enolase C-terminal domain-like protein [Actinopolymorpha alba]|uniref:enolase C-terminal domain-like protein n=1 Tax=Actinopolymorpha alba TaxID=533267 RepID=UPI00037DAD2B|nr:enolase C-terminal domain-like protein [Actinopolymorpha alba]
MNTSVDAPQPLAAPPWHEAGSGTRITGVRAILTAPENITLVVVRIDTSEPGLYGLGCATFTQRAQAVAEAVDSYLAPQLIGRDPADITDIASSLLVSSYWRFGPVLNNALSGVDMALWDLKGKQAGLPVWQLLGGRCRGAVPVYAHASGRDAVEVEDAVRGYVEAGYRHVRCQVGIPGALTYGAPAAGGASAAAPRPGLPANAWEPDSYLRVVPELFGHLRNTLGEDVHLLHDVHERLHPTQAVRLAKELEPFHLFFLEDLLAPEDLGWLPTVRAQTATPLAIGELFTNPAEYVPLVKDRLIDFVRCHVSAIGGLTPAWRLASAAELFGVRTAWHGPGDVSPIGHAANLALDLAAPNFGIQEQHVFNDAAAEVFPGCPEVRDGHLWPSDAPGLGVDLDEKLAERFPPVGPLVKDAWTRTRLPDGTVQRP